MRVPPVRRLRGLADWMLAVFFIGGLQAAWPAEPPAHSAPPATTAVSAALDAADHLRSTDHAGFAVRLDALKAEAGQAADWTDAERWHLRYLEAWEAAYRGEYPSARRQLDAIIADAPDPALRYRALATSVNLLAETGAYLEAFERTNQLLQQMPGIGDPALRYQALGEAAQLMALAGQYALAIEYAQRMRDAAGPGDDRCKPAFVELRARFRNGELDADAPAWKEGLARCADAGTSVFANAMRMDWSEALLAAHRPAEAITLLEHAYPRVQRDQYKSVVAGFRALLARAWLARGDEAKARAWALDAMTVDDGSKTSRPRVFASDVLYTLAKRHGDADAALVWLEKRQQAENGNLGDEGARALAYQTVRQEVQARKLEVDALAKQNRILQLQQDLDRKAAEASRLYILLLLAVLGFIALWAWRTRRSLVRFRHLSRQDGLTGVSNRRFFMSEASARLDECRRGAREAGLVLLDLDHFKRINDTWGHAAGDEVLRLVSAAVRAHLRADDVFGRLGGEEFGILLPDCSLANAAARAEAIRAAVAALECADCGPGHVVSGSFGVVSSARHGYDLHHLLVRADEVMYGAKGAGRDQVLVDRPAAEAAAG